ncbi:MAG: glucose-1-phosphate adenylyltransferase subunit GlgD [Candidatus Krumholzibacteria bacterium]|nr:glucose-1-phosphate adenylyltransferase subunit GlgD [Candidatus Krumholzibacteria bacterium]
MKALVLILAGGTGAELSVLTRHRAKTAVPFGGRYRVIDFCLSNCVHSGLHEIAVLAQYSPKSLIDHIGMGRPWDLDRKTGGVYILQPTHNGEAATWYLGTADALYQNIDLIKNSRADTILVLSGDQIYMMDYQPLLRHHIEKGKPVTLAIKEVQASERSRFGMVRCSREGLVTAFREKPAASTFRCASLGIYVFQRDFLLDALGPGKPSIVFDIVIPLLKRRGVAGYPFDGYWEDIGSIRSYYRSSLQLLRNRLLITDPDWPIFTMGSELPPARCADGSRVSDSIVADGCVVKGRVSGSILFPGVKIEKGASVKDSIVFSYSRIGRGARVTRAILDKFVVIGSEATVGGQGRGGAAAGARGTKRSHDETGGIAVLGRGARVAQGAGVRAGTLVEPHACIGTRR